MRKKELKFDPIEIADAIITDLNVHRLSTGSKPQLLTFDSRVGLFVLGDHQIEVEAQNLWLLEQMINDVEEPLVYDRQVQEIFKAVRRNAGLIHPEELNDPQRQIVVFRNGVLDLRTIELHEHSPRWKYTIGIPHEFNPDAKCRRFNKFIDEILPPESHRLIKQIMGYLLIPSTAFRKFFVFLGEGANGKSTLIEVIVVILGPQNVSHQSLHDLASGRFAKAELFGKLANTNADIESRDVKNSGVLKQLVAGDSMQYEKKYRDPFGGPATARLLFSANKMPVIRDTSEAIFDRLVLLDFPYRFEENEQDKSLLPKLTVEGEIEGILVNWAIPGLLSLLESKQFEIPERSDKLLKEYRRRSDPFLEFAEESIEVAPDEFVTRQDLYQSYLNWCEAQGIRHPMSQTEFNARVCEMFDLSKYRDRRAPGTRDRVWPGIQLKNPSQIPSVSQVKPLSLLANPKNPKK